MKTSLYVTDPEWAAMGESGREECRAWLRSAGGDPNITRGVTVEGEGTVIAEVVVEDEQGRLQFTENREILLRREYLIVATPPPWFRW